ncbi:hypothetical protein NUSPORA_01004 [Nucleospora cyclopteri]
METFDNVLVCEEGHTIANTLVGNEDDDFVAVGKKLKVTAKRKKIQKSTSLGRSKEFFNTLKTYFNIFQKAKAAFNFKNNRYFKLYTETFNNEYIKITSEKALKDIFDNKKCNFYGYEDYALKYSNLIPPSEVIIDKTADLDENSFETLSRDYSMKSIDIFALIYLSKRSEEEEKGKIYSYNKFAETLKKFNFRRVVKSLNVDFSKISINTLNDCAAFYRITALDKAVSRFTAVNHYKTGRSRKAFMDTGVYSTKQEKIMCLFRKYIKKDEKVYKMYMKNILNTVKMDFQIEEAKFYYFFDKFLAVLSPEKVFVPELVFCGFLAYFIGEFHRENFSEAVERIIEFLGLKKGSFLKTLKDLKELMNATENPEKFEKFINEGKKSKYGNFETAMNFIKNILIKRKWNNQN